MYELLTSTSTLQWEGLGEVVIEYMEGTAGTFRLTFHRNKLTDEALWEHFYEYFSIEPTFLIQVNRSSYSIEYEVLKFKTGVNTQPSRALKKGVSLIESVLNYYKRKV